MPSLAYVPYDPKNNYALNVKIAFDGKNNFNASVKNQSITFGIKLLSGSSSLRCYESNLSIGRGQVGQKPKSEYFSQRFHDRKSIASMQNNASWQKAK